MGDHDVIHEDVVESVSNEDIQQVNEGGGGCWWRVAKLNGVVREELIEKVKEDLKEVEKEEL